MSRGRESRPIKETLALTAVLPGPNRVASSYIRGRQSNGSPNGDETEERYAAPHITHNERASHGLIITYTGTQ